MVAGADSDALATARAEFDALVEDLVATLDRFAVPTAEQGELLGILGPLREDIVKVEAPETGTPLRESYRAAPPIAIA